MTIRMLELRDLPALARLYYQFWGEKSCLGAMERKFAELSKNEAYILLCAEEDGQLVGSVMGVACEELYGDCRPFMVLENMIVDQTRRRTGAGRLLLEELERRAIAQGCSQIILVTEADRAEACAFYERMGFHPARNRGFKKLLP